MAEKTNKEKLYLKLIDGHTRAYPSKTKTEVQYAVAGEWREIKKCPDLQQKVEAKLQEWKNFEIKHRAKFLSFWGKASQPSVKTKTESKCHQSSVSSKVQTTDSKETPSTPSTSQDLQQSQSMGTVAYTPKQNKLRDEIVRKELVLVTLKKRKILGLFQMMKMKAYLRNNKT